MDRQCLLSLGKQQPEIHHLFVVPVLINVKRHLDIHGNFSIAEVLTANISGLLDQYLKRLKEFGVWSSPFIERRISPGGNATQLDHNACKGVYWPWMRILCLLVPGWKEKLREVSDNKRFYYHVAGPGGVRESVDDIVDPPNGIINRVFTNNLAADALVGDGIFRHG